MVRKYRRATFQTAILERLEDRQLLNGDISQSVRLSEFAQLPLSFQPSRSEQTPNEVQYLANTADYSVALDSTGATLRMSGNDSPIRLSLISSSPSAVATGEDPLAGTTNQFISNKPSAWTTGATSYSHVRYANVYPGIDLTYYGNQGRLEYDFIVAPGASPSSIHMGVSGAGTPSLDASGNLVIHTGTGDLIEQAPTLYQDVAGAHVPVAGRYTINANGEVGFSVGAYDTTRPLVIDPVLGYSIDPKQADGSGFVPYTNALDSAGNLYVVGADSSLQGARKIVVAKYDPTGKLLYSTMFGGTGDNIGLGIAIDTVGDAYVTGYSDAADFPTTEGAFQRTVTFNSFGGDRWHAFVTKLDLTGSTMLYSTYLAGDSTLNYATGIAVNSAGNAMVVGYTGSPGFPTTAGAYRTDPASAFVTELNADGTGLIYSTYFGTGSFQDFANGIALGPDGAVYITGQTASRDFPITSGAANSTYGGNYVEGFVTKLNPTATDIEYSTFINNVNVNAIVVDASGSAYVTGGASPSFVTTPGAFQATVSGIYAVPFVAKLNSNGTMFDYATFLGDSGSGGRIAVDSSGSAVVVGYTDSTDFPTTPDVPQPTLGGGNDGFVTELNGSGSGLVFSTYFGGKSDDTISGVAVDRFDNVYVVGTSSIAKILVLDPSVTTLTVSPNPAEYGQAITFKANVKGSGTEIPTGTVTFFDGTATLGKASLDANGNATLTVPYLAVLTYNISATYNGGGNIAPSTTAAPTTLDVALASTTTSFTVSTLTNPPTFNQVITFTAKVQANGSQIPSGVVTFYDGNSPIGSVPLDASGVAVFTISNLGAGTHTIIPVYGTSHDFASSTAASPAVITIARATTTTSLITYDSALTPNAPLALVANVTASSGLPPMGSVTFYVNGIVLGQADLTNGTALLFSDSLPIGVDVLTTVYHGDANNTGSSSPATTVRVGNAVEQFLNGVYLQLLNRPIDAASLGIWESALSKGTSPAKFVNTIAAMPQARIVAIQNAYLRDLGVLPTPGQITAALKLKPFSSSVVAAQILSSPAYYQKVGGTSVSFLSGLSRDVLAGAPLPASFVKSATRSLAGHTSHTKIVQTLLRTTQARVAGIISTYLEILDRPATAAEAKKFLKQMNRGATTDTLTATLLASPEYMSRFAK